VPSLSSYGGGHAMFDCVVGRFGWLWAGWPIRLQRTVRRAGCRFGCVGLAVFPLVGVDLERGVGFAVAESALDVDEVVVEGDHNFQTVACTTPPQTATAGALGLPEINPNDMIQLSFTAQVVPK
jgi:hypothetical protein